VAEDGNKSWYFGPAPAHVADYERRGDYDRAVRDGNPGRVEIAQLMSMSDDDLFAALADSTTSGVSPLDLKRRVVIGKAIFRDWLEANRAKLCDTRRQFLQNDENEIGVRDIAFLIDAFEAATDHHPPLATCVVLAAKYGLDRVCDGSQ
jgi:hypothetical protein